MGKNPRGAKPHHAVSKIPRGASLAPNIQTLNFQWRMDEIEWDGEWGWQDATSEQFVKHIIPKLHNLESMTWGTLEGPTGCHFVEIKDLCGKARERIVRLGKDETGRLFSVRVTGKMRVWGFRDGAILRVLWWDPEHTVWPVDLQDKERNNAG